MGLLNSRPCPSYRALTKLLSWLGLCFHSISKGGFINLIMNSFAFLTLTGGYLVAPCSIFQTLNLKRVHHHIILRINQKKGGRRKREWGQWLFSRKTNSYSKYGWTQLGFSTHGLPRASWRRRVRLTMNSMSHFILWKDTRSMCSRVWGNSSERESLSLDSFFRTLVSNKRSASPGGVLKMDYWALPQNFWFSESVYLSICISCKFPGDAEAAVQGPFLENHRNQWSSSLIVLYVHPENIQNMPCLVPVL